MQRISVYIPEDTKQRITLISKAKSKLEAEIIRDALGEGLDIIYPLSNSAQSLLNLAKMGEKMSTPPGTPRDVSTNHDYYAWGGQKKNKND